MRNFSEISQLYNSTRKCTGGMINSPPNSTDLKTSLIKFLIFRNYSSLHLYAKKYSNIKFFWQISKKFLRNFSTLQLSNILKLLGNFFVWIWLKIHQKFIEIFQFYTSTQNFTPECKIFHWKSSVITKYQLILLQNLQFYSKKNMLVNFSFGSNM